MRNQGKPITQRQLRVGEMIKQALGMIFIRGEAKIPNLEALEPWAMVGNSRSPSKGLGLGSSLKLSGGVWSFIS